MSDPTPSSAKDERASSVLACIFARGGSKGLPGKNIKPLDGKPLIVYAIEAALGSKYVEEVFISTDDDAIAKVAESAGAKIAFMRPAELAQDTSPEWLAWRHAIETIAKSEGSPRANFLSVPATSPFRTHVDVDACMGRLLAGDCDMVLTVTEPHRNPYFNMVQLDESGYADLVSRPEKAIERRQDAPPVFDITTVAYAASTDFVLKHDSLFAGRTRTVLVPEERALDIDTPRDFEYAEFLMERMKRLGLSSY